MTMKNPPHPGEIIRELCLEPLGLTVTRAAQGLGVTRKTLSLLVNGHAGPFPGNGRQVVPGFWPQSRELVTASGAV